MNKRITDRQIAKKAAEKLSKGKVHKTQKMESLPGVSLSQFFRDNGLPNVASLIDDLEHTPAK